MRGNFDDLWMNQHEFGERTYLIQGLGFDGGRDEVTQLLPSSIQTFATFAAYGEVSCAQLERAVPAAGRGARGEVRGAGGFPACTCLIACRRHPSPLLTKRFDGDSLVCLHSQPPSWICRPVDFFYFFYFPSLYPRGALKICSVSFLTASGGRI